jgi:hypothetical protein
MNKRDMQQLKASIARDLVQGQSENSATRELLKQYVPLGGIVSNPEPEIPLQLSVENCLAPRATVAQNDIPAWHGATVAPHATLAYHATQARYARVKGDLRVPNTINFSLFPTLDPFAKAVYYQLFLLSHGFRKDTCLINLPTLARLVLMSQRKVQNTIVYLESRGLIKRIGSKLGGEKRGNYYRVLIPENVAPGSPNIPPENCDENEDDCMARDATLAPRTSLAPHATAAQGATIKNDDDDIKIKNKSSSKGEETEFDDEPVENHTCAAAPPEKETAEQNFLLVREAYEKATGNRWNQSDSETYEQSSIGNVPAAKIVSVLETVARRTPTKINSFKYFVKEITTQPDPRNRTWQKKRFEKIVHKIRDISVGRGNYSMSDFVEDVKCSCAREGIVFENDLFNELVS